MKFDFAPDKPIYQQIIDEIKKAIARGELRPGDKLPSQRELAAKAKVNQNTVQRAYRELEITNLAETLRGQGTFVSKDKEVLRGIQEELARQALERFVEEMYSLGFSDDEIIDMVARQCRRRSEKLSKNSEVDSVEYEQ